MAFIYKELIENTYNKCAELLDNFDEPQIKAIYDYIEAINSKSNYYKLMSFSSRSAILVYLIKLKGNENECEERIVADRFHDIFTFMSALALLKVNYQINDYFKK